MNLLHMKYAVEVARVGSLNKASETLLVAAPNISRSIKELESNLGITIFNRTAKGVTLTPEGEKFMTFAKSILKQIDDVENFYKNSGKPKQKFSISVPRASYISDAFVEFSNLLTTDDAEIFYKETNSQRVINNILDREYRLGIIRYAENYDKFFKSMLDEKDLCYEMVSEFTYQLLMSKKSPLADKDNVTFDDLRGQIEIAHADPYVPSLPMSKVIKDELPDNIGRRIYIFERASQFDLLSKNIQTFMWVSPTPSDIRSKYGLIQKKCVDNKKVYKDVLIYKNGYKLTELDKQFITCLCNSKRENM